MASTMDGQSTLLSAARDGDVALVARLVAESPSHLNVEDKNGRTPLSLAAEHGRGEVVELLLAQEGIDVNSKDWRGRSALSWASAKGQWHATSLLLAKDGVDKDSKDHVGRTPFSLALESGNSRMIPLLLEEKSIDRNSTDRHGQTPLSYAAKSGNSEIVQLLLKERDVDRNNVDFYGQTPLLSAAEQGHSQTIQVLLDEKDVDRTIEDHSGRTTLFHVIRHSYTEIVKLLLWDSEGNNLNLPGVRGPSLLLWAAENRQDELAKLVLDRFDVDVECRDWTDCTPLMWAVRNGSEELVKDLLMKGASLEARETEYGRTPLLWAVANGHHEVARLLLATGRVNPDSMDINKRTPLSWAAETGDLATVQLLLDNKGVDINSVDDRDWTPLIWAIAHKRFSVVEILLEQETYRPYLPEAIGQAFIRLALKKGSDSVRLLLEKTRVDPNCKDARGQTLLSCAAAQGDVAVARLLLARGHVDQDSKDAKGKTPLSLASAEGHGELVRLLLQQEQVDPDSRDSDDRTPLYHAAGSSHDVARLLLEHPGVDPTSKDRYGGMPLHQAAFRGQSETVRMFLADERIDPAVQDVGGRTPLSWAAAQGHGEVVRMFLADERMDPDVKDRDGRTPLIFAVGRGFEGRNASQSRHEGKQHHDSRHPPLVESASVPVPAAVVVDYLVDYETTAELLLAKEGVDINGTDRFGRTPLSWAAGNADLPMVNILLRAKDIDVNSTDYINRTPLSWAAAGEDVLGEEPTKSEQLGSGEEERFPASRTEVVIRLLEEAQTDPNIMDDHRLRPLFWALKHMRASVAQALLGAEDTDVHAKSKQERAAFVKFSSHSFFGAFPGRLKKIKNANTTEQESLTPRWDSAKANRVLADGLSVSLIRALGMDADVATFARKRGVEEGRVLNRFKNLLTQYCKGLRDQASTPQRVLVVCLLEHARHAICRMARRSLRAGHSMPNVVQRRRRRRAAKRCFDKLNSQFKELFPKPTGHEASAALAFLVGGRPMGEFRANLRKLVNNAAWEQDVLQASRSFPASLPDIVDALFHGLQLQFWEPAVGRGNRRLRWTCSCGMRLYDDFQIDCGDAALDELEAVLNAKGTHSPHDSEGGGAVTGFGQQAVRLLSKGAESIKRLLWPPKPILPSHDLRLSTLPIQSSSIELDSLAPLYLLHCRSSGRYGIKFDQDLICDDMNDRTLFEFLRSVLRRAQRGNKWLTLRNTTSINLSKFHVDYSRQALVDYCEGCMQQRALDCVCVPPPDLVGREYKCHPTPPKRRPPLGKNYLMHYLLNPDHLSREQTWAYQQLPKRIKEPLPLDPGHTTPGWGLYFEDGWNIKTIYILLVLANVVGSLVFGICWGFFKMDVQGAFGITSYWIGVVAVAMGGLVLRSTHQL